MRRKASSSLRLQGRKHERKGKDLLRWREEDKVVYHRDVLFTLEIDFPQCE